MLEGPATAEQGARKASCTQRNPKALCAWQGSLPDPFRNTRGWQDMSGVETFPFDNALIMINLPMVFKLSTAYLGWSLPSNVQRRGKAAQQI